ncbi:MAG: hypothetical protein IJT27_03990 [Clostridia bacterium]|nr:hypothetical protein [Clostridia bacterium]
MIVKIAAVGLIGVTAFVVIKHVKPELAPLTELACAVVLFFLVAGELSSLKSSLVSALETVRVDSAYVEILIKVLGAAVVTQFAADTARDNGMTALAGKIEFSGRVLMIALALPVFRAVLQLLSAMS